MGKPPPPPPGAERRRAERVELLAQVELRKGDGEVVILPVINVSVGGIFLKIESGMLVRGLRAGDPVGVFLDLGDDDPLSVDAEVVRVDLLGGPGRQPGIALMWTTADPSFVEKLGRTLKRFAG